MRALANTAEAIIDLVVPVDPERDHIRGPEDAPVTLVEYGDFECPYCGQAEQSVRELLAEFGDDLRYVWRHLPLADVHPRAQLAAEASEAAGAQGKFWEMYEHLLTHQDELRPNDLWTIAEKLGLDRDRFSDELRRHVYANRIAEDVDGADQAGVSGTPTFFVNGLRHQGAYDAATLAAGGAHARAGASSPRGRRPRRPSDPLAVRFVTDAASHRHRRRRRSSRASTTAWSRACSTSSRPCSWAARSGRRRSRGGCGTPGRWSATGSSCARRPTARCASSRCASATAPSSARAFAAASRSSPPTSTSW